MGNQLPVFVQYIEEVCQEFGGEYWCQEKIITAVKEFVYNGGGFIEVGEPAAISFREEMSFYHKLLMKPFSIFRWRNSHTFLK